MKLYDEHKIEMGSWLSDSEVTSRLKEKKARFRPKRLAAAARLARRDLTVASWSWPSRVVSASLRRQAEEAARMREHTAEKKPRERSGVAAMLGYGGGGRRLLFSLSLSLFNSLALVFLLLPLVHLLYLTDSLVVSSLKRKKEEEEDNFVAWKRKMGKLSKYYMRLFRL